MPPRNDSVTVEAPSQAAEPQVAGEIILVPVDQVRIGQRLREIDPVWAEALGRVMVKEGQQTPIEVCRLPGKPGWELVAGAHRLTGARTVGMELIEAREVSNSVDFRKLREASENLWRRGLDPLARAAHIAELVRLHKLRAGIDPDKDGRAVSVAARWQKVVAEEALDTTATIAVVYGWDEAVAGELGFSPRTVRDDLTLYRRLPAGAVAALRECRHPILANAAQLKALAKLEGERQSLAIQRLTQNKCKSVAEALANMPGAKRPADPGAKRLSAFIGAFQRMSLSERKGALEHLLPLLPAGYTVAVGGGAELRSLIALIEDLLLNEHDAGWVVGQLEQEHGATARFLNGTYELKLAKVAATCTAGGEGLLRAWVRAAQRRLSAGAGA